MSETYVLAHPVTRKVRQGATGAEVEDTLSEVEVRRLNGGDLRWLEGAKDKPGSSLGMISRVTGLDTKVVDLLDAEDIAAIGELLESFLPASLRSGDTSSGT